MVALRGQGNWRWEGSFANKHMITITPSGHQNVTDSFIQVGDMFAEKAKAVGTEGQ